MPLDIFLTNRGGEVTQPPHETLQQGEGALRPVSSSEYVSVICRTDDLGGFAMMVSVDDAVEAARRQEQIEAEEAIIEGKPPSYDGLVRRIVRGSSIRMPIMSEGKPADLVLRHRIE